MTALAITLATEVAVWRTVHTITLMRSSQAFLWWISLHSITNCGDARLRWMRKHQ